MGPEPSSAQPREAQNHEISSRSCGHRHAASKIKAYFGRVVGFFGLCCIKAIVCRWIMGWRCWHISLWQELDSIEGNLVEAAQMVGVFMTHADLCKYRCLPFTSPAASYCLLMPSWTHFYCPVLIYPLLQRKIHLTYEDTHKLFEVKV